MTPEPSRLVRFAVVTCLLGGHVTAYGATALAGRLDPGEPFNLLLLGANLVIALILLRGTASLLLGGGIMFLIGAHTFVGQHLAPDALTGGAALVVNILVLYVGVRLHQSLPGRYLAAFAASYFALFFAFIEIKWSFLIPGLAARTGMGNAAPLFLLFLLGLCACARSWRLLAYFWAVTVSFTFLQPYAWESTFVLCFIVTALFGARGALRSPVTLVFLGTGLALVCLVLFPVVAAIMGESPLNLGNVLADPLIRKAIGRTLLTATISTLLLLLAAVPLAYALARLAFRGRALLLAAIDLPIIVPQSVAGIALVQVFGPRQPLGEAINRALGVSFDGTLWGVCLAQIFVAMPFIMKAALAAFESVPAELELSARTLGASPCSAFRRVALPLASRGVFLGAVLAWARAAGEFGALYVIAPTPETAPVAAWNRFNGPGGLSEAAPLVTVLLGFSLVMFFLLQLVTRALPRSMNAPAASRGEGAP